MKKTQVSYFIVVFFFILALRASSSRALNRTNDQLASVPPRGWNSYDSFCWTVSEEEFLQNAEIVSKRLRPLGYEYVVVDYLWYRKKVPGAYVDSLGFDVIDKWGRMQPDPGRWPSSKDEQGFKEVASKVHAMGLKFGIHIMRGISTQAVNENTPIWDSVKGEAYQEGGRYWKAKDIALPEKPCAWMQHGFMAVNTKLGAGKAFLQSLYQQYAEWGVDFVKHDCVFGDDLDLGEITIVSEVLRELDHPIVYSLSPGTSVTPAMAKDVSGLVNMYRITGDDWDTWGDVVSHFDVTRDFAAANMIGYRSATGSSWPDLDMLPLGWLTDPGSNEGPHRSCRLTIDEQKTQMTLWSMAKSPLMFGGDLRKIDDLTFSIIAQPSLLEINAFSSNNREFPFITAENIPNSKDGSYSSFLSKRYSTNEKEPEDEVFHLTSCKEPKANGWLAEVLDQNLEKVCWKRSTRDKIAQPFCLHKRTSLVTSDEETINGAQHQGKLHLLPTYSMEVCLDASPNWKLTSREENRGSFSPCKRSVNQMWELSSNGSLQSSYSGQCAVLKRVKARANAGGVRAWVASGRRGELYMAFFNLNAQKTLISAQIAALRKVLPGKTFIYCNVEEVWSGKDFGNVKVISTPVEMHGTALFILTKCS